MGDLARFGVGFLVTISVAVGGVIYRQVFHGGLFEAATVTHSGPFSQYVETLDAIVPIVLVGVLLFAWAWVILGGAQREAARRRVRR